MTLLSKSAFRLVAAALMTAALAGVATSTHAQCSTCPTPTVAWSPVISTPVVSTQVVAAPVMVAPVRTGWYPGRMFDQMRLNRWGFGPSTQVQTVALAPAVQTVGFTPTTVQTVGFAPSAIVQTVNFAPSTPYVTAFAPMQRQVVQTTLMPVTTVASGCSSCATASVPTVTTTSFAPTAVLQPVMETSGCSACAAAAPCSDCAASSAPMATQAVYAEASTGCSSCAAAAAPAATSDPYYSTVPATSGGVPVGSGVGAAPATPPPTLAPEEAAPLKAQYPPKSDEPVATPESKTPETSVVDPQALPDEEEAKPAESDTSTSIEAPPLLTFPQGDRTANRPTVDIHDAVYRQPVRKSNVSATTTAAKVVVPASTQPLVDANGWESVEER